MSCQWGLEVLAKYSRLPREPGDSHRTIILGRTGSGKTQFAFDLMSRQSWDQIPWIVFDIKGEELFERLRKRAPDRVRVIDIKDKPPRKPGLYIVRPSLGIDDEYIEPFLMNIYRQEDTGLYIDEGYAIDGRSRAFNAILTQGRSKSIPVIALYQRPVYMSRFAVAQADFFAVFSLSDQSDLRRVSEYVASAVEPESGLMLRPGISLDNYFSIWHDVGNDTVTLLRPVPKSSDILESYLTRLYPAKYSQETVKVT